MNRKKLLQLLLAGGMIFSTPGLWGKETQSKVLLPPEIGYKNLRTALSFARSFYKKGEYEKAAGFLNMFFRTHNRKKHNMLIFYNALALKAQLQNDEKALFAVLREMVKYDPALSSFTKLEKKPE